MSNEIDLTPAPPDAGGMPPAGDPLRPSAETAVATAFAAYVDERRKRIAPFCRQHFSITGAWRINRHALGHDLWKAPANVLWAGPYLLARAGGALLGRAGWASAADRLRRLPPGFETAVAREVEWLVYTELLELPIDQGTRRSDRDALLETVIADEFIARLAEAELLELNQLAGAPEARRRLEDFLTDYTHSRTAAADLSGSLLSLAAGAGGFGKLTPGTLALGQAAAGAIAQQLAIANFALGPTLGGDYDALFPAAASTGLILASVGALMATLGTITALTGFVTDPVQQALGLHERRLHRLLDALERELNGERGSLQLRDAYVARVFDLVDLIRAAVRAVRPG